jgi:hypothetical protein
MVRHICGDRSNYADVIDARAYEGKDLTDLDAALSVLAELERRLQ